MTAHVNENCIGCGLCTGICPTAFLMTDEGVAAARDEILPEWEGQVQEAAECGPTRAIYIQHSTQRGRAQAPPPLCSILLPVSVPISFQWVRRWPGPPACRMAWGSC